MLRAPRVPAGKPVGPGSGRWWVASTPRRSELSTELSVVKRFRCLDREFGPHPGGRLFLLVSGWKAAFGKPPAPVEPFRATGKVQRGCLLIESGRKAVFVGQAGNYSQV